jgi:hypothetical protein
MTQHAYLRYNPIVVQIKTLFPAANFYVDWTWLSALVVIGGNDHDFGLVVDSWQGGSIWPECTWLSSSNKHYKQSNLSSYIQTKMAVHNNNDDKMSCRSCFCVIEIHVKFSARLSSMAVLSSKNF